MRELFKYGNYLPMNPNYSFQYFFILPSFSLVIAKYIHIYFYIKSTQLLNQDRRDQYFPSQEMYQPSLKMQTAKQQFEPQRAGWKKIIYSCVFAVGITLNHTQFLHLLGMLSVWNQNKSIMVGTLPRPHFLQITFYFSEIQGQETELPAQIQMPCLYLDHRQRNASKVGYESMTDGSWENKSLFSSFCFQKSLNQYPTCNCTKGHRSRVSNTNTLKPFKFDTVQRQKYSCMRTIISNYLGRRAFGIERVYVNLALPFVFSEFYGVF